MRRHLTTIVVAFFTALVAAGGPPLAAAVFDAENARNADKVDNLHAVGPGATAAQRAGKLVGANSVGRIPDADKLDGLNSTQLQRRITGKCIGGRDMVAVNANGSVACQPEGVRTIYVASADTAQLSGKALREAVLGIPTSGPSVPTSNRPWLVDMEPGLFDLGSTGLVLPSFVSLRGTGPATRIVCVCDTNSATVQAGVSSRVASLAVQNIGGGAESAAIDATQIGVTLVDLRIESSGGTVRSLGVLANSSTLMRNLDVLVEGVDGTGIRVDGVSGSASITNSVVSLTGSGSLYGIEIYDATTHIRDVRIDLGGAGGGAGISARDATVSVVDVDANVGSGSASSGVYYVFDGDGKSLTIASSRFVLGGLFVEDGDVRVSGSQLHGGGEALAGTMKCVNSFDQSYDPLTAACQVVP